MTSAELERAERRTKQKWYELVKAEEQGASMQVLERLHGLYMLAIEEYNRAAFEQERQEQDEQRQPDTVSPRPSGIRSFFGSKSA
ncbi:MAG: hypothetical protein H0U76_08210 [Ktedonobacteraceae bacterium]|nr:hypothetical protein [Ktedonobacteraceae bacterium]